jgi:molybdopterin-containing oxidoreductase family iron-sulfur binding subunit
MDRTRRRFLQLAGAGVVGAAGGTALRAVAREPETPGAVESVQPQAGISRRWAMVVNLKAVERHHSWDRIIEACHRAHNVPHFSSAKDEVKWIWTEEFEAAFPSQEQPYVTLEHHDRRVPVLCNHCDNPPCTRVCPTEATWKRESDGIVMMDWHRCIGCRYCVVACPYGSRSFNWRDPRTGLEEITKEFPTRMRGVVEKCTFCEERIARGLGPACAEACEHGEIVFGDLEDANSEVRRLLREHFTIRRKPTLGTQPQVYYIV